MNQATRYRAIAIAVSSLLLLAAGTANAQNSFGQPAQQQPLPQQQQRPQQSQQVPQQQNPQQDPYANAPQQQPDRYNEPVPAPMPRASNETQDFGVAATPQLRPTEQLHAPTPTTIPGGQVIGTQQLAQLLQGGQNRVLLLDLYGGPQHLPGAVAAGPAAQGGSFDDSVQQGFGQFLQQAAGGDNARMIVVYCGGVQCWSSYNAALRAMKLGYRNVAWFRGGIEAWQQAGLPMQGSNGQGQGPSQ